MKRLNLPTVNDDDILAEVADYITTDAPATRAVVVAEIQQAYDRYRACNGDPHAFVRPTVSDQVKGRLQRKYSDPLVSMGYIETVRYQLSADCCPICGSLAPTGTVDHYLPQSLYPELSIFSLNLLPACGCNSLRGADFRGPTPGHRPLHPYFDTFLDQQLYVCRIHTPATGVGRPHLEGATFSLELVDPAHAFAAAMLFQITSVISKTTIENFFITEWGKIIARPNHFFGWVTNRPTSRAELVVKLNEVVGTYNYQAGTPNNWRSMLVYGILDNVPILDELIRKIQGSP